MNRAKNGSPAVHPIAGRELGGPASAQARTGSGIAVRVHLGARKLVARLGVAAKLKFPVHPHMLRHACGYQLANQGVDTRALQAYLGHRNIQHTVRYTELASTRFKNFWKD